MPASSWRQSAGNLPHWQCRSLAVRPAYPVRQPERAHVCSTQTFECFNCPPWSSTAHERILPQEPPQLAGRSELHLCSFLSVCELECVLEYRLTECAASFFCHPQRRAAVVLRFRAEVTVGDRCPIIRRELLQTKPIEDRPAQRQFRTTFANRPGLGTQPSYACSAAPSSLITLGHSLTIFVTNIRHPAPIADNVLVTPEAVVYRTKAV